MLRERQGEHTPQEEGNVPATDGAESAHKSARRARAASVGGTGVEGGQQWRGIGRVVKAGGSLVGAAEAEADEDAAGVELEEDALAGGPGEEEAARGARGARRAP